jgi:hypothetical protein
MLLGNTAIQKSSASKLARMTVRTMVGAKHGTMPYFPCSNSCRWHSFVGRCKRCHKTEIIIQPQNGRLVTKPLML